MDTAESRPLGPAADTGPGWLCSGAPSPGLGRIFAFGSLCNRLGVLPPVIVNLPRRPRSWEAASCKPPLLLPSSAHAFPSQQHRAGLGWKRGPRAGGLSGLRDVEMSWFHSEHVLI